MTTGIGEDSLSAEELAALSQAFSAPEEPRSSEEVRGDHEPVVLRYDLVGASSTQRHDFPALDLIHETYASELAESLHQATKVEPVLQIEQPDVVNFSEIYASLGTPCSVVILDVDGLGCSGLLIIEPSITLHFIDLMMGGHGGVMDAASLLGGRGFTRAEQLLVHRFVRFVEEALAKAWARITPLRLRPLRAEVDPRHAAVFMPSDRVAEFKVTAEWGDVSGDIRLVIPMIALRPFEQRLSRTAVSPPSASDGAWRERLRDALDDVPVLLTAVLGRTTMTVDELLNMNVGDLVRLDRDPHTNLDLMVEGVPRFSVTPAVHAGNMSAVLAGPLGSRNAHPSARDEDAAPSPTQE